MADKKKSSYSRVKKFRSLNNMRHELDGPEHHLATDSSVLETVDAIATNFESNAHENSKECSNFAAQKDYQETQQFPSAICSPDSTIEEAQVICVQNKRVECTPQTMAEKLRYWALTNMTTLTNKCVSELLIVLRSEGHLELPRTAETLLSTTHVRPKQSMLSKRGVEGSFIYIGIEEALNKRVDPNIYTCETIKILVSTNGMPIFNSSRKQFWPILIQIFHKDYHCVPAIVALYYGDSKPASINEFFRDFVQEAKRLTNDGIVIKSTRYTFEIMAFVCDTPARAFIKCVKAHNAFYGCERCETRGLTIARNKRVYSEMDAALRTHEKFKNQTQRAHHHESESSPLLELPNFDVVRGVVLDYMHLLCIGVMRSLFTHWFGDGKKNTKSIARVKRSKRKILREIMASMKPSVPREFQRKEFDLEDWMHWKATQFRFFLFYCGGIVLEEILSPERYQHFLLLFVACRILDSSENATMYTAYIRQLLRTFFHLMPTFYGETSQTMNFHNLIHIADDIDYMQASVSNFSSFPFENELGKIKKMIRSPNNPIVQVVNRLAEADALPDYIIRPRSVLGNFGSIKEIRESRSTIENIEIKNVVLSSSRPNNLALLNDGNIIRIKKITVAQSAEFRTSDLFIEGYLIEIKGNAFKYPQDSSKFGIFELGKRASNTLVERSGSDFDKKCIFFKILKKKYAVTLLH